MGTVNVLNQMAEYDFNAPIDVEMIFEDCDDDDPSFQSALSERENISDSNYKQDKISSENQINDIDLNKSMLSLNKSNRILKISGNNLNNCKNTENRNNTNYVGHYHDQNTFDANQRALVLINDGTVINIEESLPSPHQRNDPDAKFIEDVLNKLSENIIHIMQSFYQYGIKKTNEDNKKREDIFHSLKSHFFELSYTTLESIFLPQEQNENFINQFLDNTVLLANSKSMSWKCHRGHVLPFFKELLTWTKEKREHIKTKQSFRIPCHSNENIMFKQQMMRPLLPLNFPQSEIVANNNIATQKTHNNLCIFSSGTPGNEICINIDADTLIQINERQQCITTERQQCITTERQHCITAERNGKHNNVTPSCEATRRKTPIAKPTYRNRVKDIQKKNPQYDRPPPPYKRPSPPYNRPSPPYNRSPPPYNVNHSSKHLPYRPQRCNRTNVNTNQIYYNNIRQPRQNYQNIGQPILSYPTEVHYINTNETSPSDNNNVVNYTSMLYDNTNNNIPTHRTLLENEVTSSPVITNGSSLNPKTSILNVRCYMCGKTTTTPATPYDNSRRTPFYCSYLCQELDNQSFKPAAWSNT